MSYFLFNKQSYPSIRKLKSNPIKCTCKLKSDLADDAIRSKISDLDVTRCVNMNKTMLEAITAVNCGMFVTSIHIGR